MRHLEPKARVVVARLSIVVPRFAECKAQV